MHGWITEDRVDLVLIGLFGVDVGTGAVRSVHIRKQLQIAT